MAQTFSDKFENHVIDSWGERTNLNCVETYLLDTYITDNSLVALESGTGGGIISLYLENALGFKHLHAYDIIPEMIEKARLMANRNLSNIQFFVADASDLGHLLTGKFHYLLHFQQILSMVPQNRLNNALQEAHRLGASNAKFVFSFLDWHSRWYNPILSFNINFIRLISGRPMQKFYIPELKFKNRINWRFYKKHQHAILWVKKKHAIKKIESEGFQIISFYKEESITKQKGTAMYIVCKKR